jgi:TRAP-type uncharacterized transport system substrate-binding protein
MAVRDFLRNSWPTVAITVTVAAIACAVAAVILSMPPRVIVMATGSEGGAYQEVGKRYRAALASAGVDLRLVPTAGAVDSLSYLMNPQSGVSVALVQGGTAGPDAVSELESLGTVFLEPLWLFHKHGVDIATMRELRDLKISIGPIGSGTRARARELLKRNGLDEKTGELLALTPQESGEALLAGSIDVAAIVNSWDSPVVRRLVADERVELANFPRADAYVALYPFLNKVVVPRGAGDLAKDLPPDDVLLLAPKASLVVRKDLHPAIQYLLLNAAAQIHSAPGIFQRASQFPAAEAIDIPLSDEARQFYKSGRPFLHNYLPFWMAGQVSKLLVLLIPILGVLYPLLRSVPFAYDWMMRSRISRIYGELSFLEDQMFDSVGTGRDAGPMIAELDRIEAQANRLNMPVAYASMLYMLRNHIDVVRERLQR